MWSLGGRGGRVWRVTSLDDGGPGSLREAVEASGPRVVVFAVAGTITLTRPLVVRQPRLTIAGQTAPGDGITLRGQPLEIAADDVVVRFIRSRLGDEQRVDGDAVGVVAGRRIVIDHVSASWSTDETLSLSARFDSPERSFDEVTVQWSLIGESLNRNVAKKPGEVHGFGTLLRAARGARITMHHNLWLHHDDRMPRPGNWQRPEVDPVGALFDFRSNVFYNWGRDRAGYNLDASGTRSSYNFIDNCYWQGPSSRGALIFEESSRTAQAYVRGNWMDGVLPADPWSLVRAHPVHLPAGLPEGYRRREPLAVGPVAEDPAPLACERVLAWAGASLQRDAVDERLVEDVRLRRGRLIDSQTEVGGWPVLRGGPVAADTDGDGLPDAWERAQGLDPADPADGARVDPATGWTPLDRYLAERAAPRMPRTPTATVAAPSPPVATVRPALHLVGDSTMADKPVLDPPSPERGWGQLLRERLREPARLVNHAANGRSTARFLAEGRWHHVLGQLAPGDVVLIQFGHNDARLDDASRYAAANSTYPQLLERFVAEARARGASPVLATPLARRRFDAAGRPQDTHGAYPDAVRAVAARLQVPLLELHQASLGLLARQGAAGSTALYLHLPPGVWARFPQGLNDNTHFTESGARAMAGLAEAEVRRLGLPWAAWFLPPR
jgi:lysophospholipase L1-like esterase